MPRKITEPSQLYQPTPPDEPLEFHLDSFPPFVSKIQCSFTREGWPGQGEIVMTVIALWDSGGGARATFFGGVVPGKGGQPAPVSAIIIDVPEIADERGQPRKKAVVGGVVQVHIHQALTTSITLEAV